MAHRSESPPLVPPSPMADPSEIDLEAGPGEHIQCRICLETDGRDFIAPCKCKGTSKYVHRECLDHWRALREGFAFAHCTTCKAPYHLRVHLAADRKWRTLKFRFFVTRDILFIFLGVQLVIASLAYLVYLVDGYHQYWLRLAWGFNNELSFYYICGTSVGDGFHPQKITINHGPQSTKSFLPANLLEHYCSLLCWVYLDASSLVMTVECEMIWLSHVESCVYVAVILVVQVQPQNVGAWEVLVKLRLSWHNGGAEDMAEALPHTCQKNAN